MGKAMNLNVKSKKRLKMGTNIKDIKIPPQMRNRKVTGLAWFDDLVGDGFAGGFVPSTIAMLTGTPGAGKSTLLRQLADSITGAGHIALYNTGEEAVVQVKMGCERLELQHGFTISDDDLVEDIRKHLDHLTAENPGKQIFWLQDSLQTLDDGKYTNGIKTSGTLVRAAEAMVDWAKEKYGICIFIGQVTKNGDFAGRNTILHAVDVRLDLYIDEQKKSETFGQRLLEGGKNRYGVSGTKLVVEMNKKGLSCKGKVTDWVKEGGDDEQE
jgi:DNA repair protein RadA/Sms